jgi:hypothetical protein
MAYESQTGERCRECWGYARRAARATLRHRNLHLIQATPQIDPFDGLLITRQPIAAPAVAGALPSRLSRFPAATQSLTPARHPLGEAHTSLGFVLSGFDWNWGGRREGVSAGQPRPVYTPSE